MRCFQNMYYTKQFAEWIRLTLLLCIALHCCLGKMGDISFEPRILLNKTCAFTSCRSARQESPNDMDLDTFLTARCYCDPDCKKFQDCCYDISNTSYYAYDQTSLHWSCSHIPSQAKVLQNGTYQPRALSWTLGQDECKLKVGADYSNISLDNVVMRRCLPHVSTCALDWTNETVENLCYSYTHFVYGRVNGEKKLLNQAQTSHETYEVAHTLNYNVLTKRQQENN
ncbi:uncharacterized protein LOC124803324 [Schistocerca piceifrons]|uniref:uncharacterized protein LOC124803324 n=1 Tax=Schistocerca piceifrons TaxID=274613 RepID=UPI001F5F9F75|nr:uncharacterized protein LOC124803324 [Schistocerca piceifrons]